MNYSLQDNIENLKEIKMMNMFSNDELDFIEENYKNEFEGFYSIYLNSAFRYNENGFYLSPVEFLRGTIKELKSDKYN